MLPVQLFETLLESLVARVIFEDGERFGGGLAVGAEEADAVAVASRVNADPNAVQRSGGGGHGGTPGAGATRQRNRAEPTEEGS
jgi:hypothetical protein